MDNVNAMIELYKLLAQVNPKKAATGIRLQIKLLSLSKQEEIEKRLTSLEEELGILRSRLTSDMEN